MPDFNGTVMINTRGANNRVPRQNDEFYRWTGESSMTADTDWIEVVTLNDWNDATQIERTKEYGYKYIDLTREYAKTFRTRKGMIGATKALLLAHYYGWYSSQMLQLNGLNGTYPNTIRIIS